MNADDFRRLALSLPGAVEGSHRAAAEFRVGGRVFATLASKKQGSGNLMLTPEQQAAFVAELPVAFPPIKGGVGTDGDDPYPFGCGQRGSTGRRGALRTAWKRRMGKNAKAGRKAASASAAGEKQKPGSRRSRPRAG